MIAVPKTIERADDDKKNDFRSYQLTLLQRQIVLAQRLTTSLALYNLTFSYLFKGPININAFKRAFKQLVSEADCLRIQIDTNHQLEELRVYQDSPIELEVIDFTHTANPDLSFEDWIIPLAEAPVDLSCMVMRSVLALLDENRAQWVISLNHIVADGYGVYLLYKRLKILYEAFAAGESVPALNIAPYETLLNANRAYIESPQYSQDVDYWRAIEKSALGPVQLYGRICRGEPAAARRIEVELEADLVRRLYELAMKPEFQAKTINVSLFNLMVTAYSVFLSQASGQTEFMIGVPFLNRPGPLRTVPGLAIASVPLHVMIDPAESYASLYERIRETSKEAARHSRLPVPNHKNQLFNVMFNFHNRSYGAGSDRIEHRWYSACDTFDMVLNVYNPEESYSKLILAFDFSCETFDEELQSTAIQHFLRALASLLEDPQRCVMYPCLLTEEERLAVIYGPNPVITPYRGSDVIQLFTSQVMRTPENLAVESHLGNLSYQELDEQSSRLANFLCAQELGSGKSIGVYLDRTPELAVAMLAIWKAGSVYVPLDASYPVGRLEFMIQDAGVVAVLTRKGISKFGPEAVARILCMEEFLTAWQPAALPDRPQPFPLLLDSPAYIIYTSGSTGRPKGVCVSHRGLVGYLEAELAMLQLFPDDRVLYFAAPGFDASLEEILPTLLAGATLSLRPESLLSLGEFNRLLAERSITVLSLPAAFWGEWVIGLEQSGESLPASLRIVMLYAEEPNIQRYISWLRLPGAEHVRWINTYGPTESVVTATVFEPTSADGDPENWVRLPIGRPLQNHAIYILDANGLPVPQRVPGEIYIGGDAALGYRNLSKETAEHFLPDPFISVRGGVMYRTGDRGRLLPTGQFEFLGRIDQQVKLNGFRIELGEIENRLESHPAIRQAVVCMKNPSGGAQRLVAYVTAVNAEDGIPDGKVLRSFLGNWLPDYMLPSNFLVLPEFPVTPNGKLDRHILPEPSLELPASNESEARCTLEAQLVSIWQKTLEIEAVGIDQDFFALGGTSLLGVRMFEEIRRQLNVWLPVAALVEAPTVRTLASYIETYFEDYRPSCAVMMQPGGPGLPLFLVHGWGGGIVGYTELVRRLVNRWPIYGLQAAGIVGEEPPDETIDAMVDRYIRAMKSVQPKGPYRVGGYCTGGIIAYAIACRLENEGEKVDLVAIIDGSAPQTPQDALPLISGKRLFRIWKSIPFWLKDYRELGVAGLRQRVLHNIHKLVKRLKENAGRSVVYENKDVLLVLDDPTPLPDYKMNLLFLQGRAIDSFHPAPYQGKVTVFTAFYPTLTKALTSPLDPAMGWRRLARGGVKVHYVMAAHRNIHLAPYCYQLAEQLEKDLIEADAALETQGSSGNL